MPAPQLERYVVVYDVTDDRRRTRIMKTLKGYGYAVQYSVFEVMVTPTKLVKLRDALARLMKAEEDSVVLYGQCPRCARVAQRLGQAEDPFGDLAILV